ncbi:uncharacterized protein [Chironomus tepperi]|uniref:uncharacterized protein n=1 Tax=Chironomus tepperi TaxID=113505 RepID=UPI00391F6147
MDFIKLIEKVACLKAYFTEFPKKLKQLAIEGKVVKLCENGIEIIDIDEFNDYLASKESIFPIKTAMDFFETLDVLQFSKICSTKNKISYSFVHPKFGKNKAISDDFYKQSIDMNCKELKSTKRMSPMHHIELFDRLIRMHNKNKVKISRLEFARLNLQYILQRKIDLLKRELDVIDHNIEEPEYSKNSDIAGYYGDVEIGTLKKVFRNYFPIYQNNAEEQMEVVHQVEEQPVDNEVPNVQDPVSQEIITDVCTIPEINNNKEQKQAEVFDDENKENQPPSKKRRKCKTRPGKISVKETADALTFLQKEFGAISSEI